MGGDQQIMLKNINRISLLNFIRRNRQATKAGLSTVTGLTFMAIKKIMEELMSLNLVREDSFETRGLGRKAVTYAINENYGYTAGLHVNIFQTTAAVLDIGGKTLATKTLDMKDAADSQTAFLNQLVELVNSTIEESGCPREKLLGLGMGVPGPVDSREGRVLAPPNFALLRYLPLREIMAEKLGINAILQKDTNAIAMGEFWRGHGAGYNTMCYIDADMGIGSSMIINGRIYEGSNCVAGEFGHITLDLNGPLCNCGNHGCLEAMASGLAALKELANAMDSSHPLYAKRDNLTIRDMLSAARRNDPLCISILNKSAYYMGVAVSSLVNILDPEIIILGGILPQEYAPYFQIVKETMLSKRFQGAQENRILPAALNGTAGAVGAGELVTDHFFTTLVSEVLLKN